MILSCPKFEMVIMEKTLVNCLSNVMSFPIAFSYFIIIYISKLISKSFCVHANFNFPLKGYQLHWLLES